ncbi:MAG: hypothetical protein R2761_18840 [Acidimicrobiales bacterium]
MIIDKTEITVTIPANSRFVALARVTAASLAAELDFTVDEISDVTVAADEVTSLVIEWAEDNEIPLIQLRYQLRDDTLEMEAAVETATLTASQEMLVLDDITRQILGAVVDAFDIREGCGRILKRRAAVAR